MFYPMKRLSPKAWVIAACLILISFFSLSRFFYAYELLTYDFRCKIRPGLQTSSDIVLIEIADDSLANLGKWPLPRDFHATVVNILKEWGAKKIVFDILFSEPTVNDDIFAQAIARAGNVYLATAFDMNEQNAAPARPVTTGRRIAADVIGELKQAAKRIGHINMIIDSDGKVRQLPLVISYNQELIPQLGAQAALDELGLSISQADFTGDQAIFAKHFTVPLNGNGRFMINYPGPWGKTFSHISYLDILASYLNLKKGAVPVIAPDMLKDKVCFIGLTATGTSDLRANTIENAYPMLGVQASIYNSFLTRKFIDPAGRWLNCLLALLLFGLCLAVYLRLSPLMGLLASAAIGFGFSAVAVILFVTAGLWIDLFLPLVVVLCVYAGIVLYRLFEEINKRQLLEKELDIARAIQQNFLPADLRQYAGLGIGAAMQPAKYVAGDFYDILPLGEYRLGAFLGDVSGKGVPASLIMAQTISLFRVFARQQHAPEIVMNELNQELCGRFESRFATALYMIIDTRLKQVSVSSAGQSPLYHYRAHSRELSEVALRGGPPLGLMPDLIYKAVSFDVAAGDALVFFSDGVYEARNKNEEEFGLDRVKDIIIRRNQSAQDLLDGIITEVNNFSLGRQQHDDITILTISVG